MNPDQLSYDKHPIFHQIEYYEDFYKSLSDSVMSYITPGAPGVINLDTYVFTSIQGTLESIRVTLKGGRINDSYTLLRKYFDSTIINVYANLYLADNFSVDNFIVKQIDDWVRGKQKLPRFSDMYKYIKRSEKLSAIRKHLNDQVYSNIRDRCNDHTHYNYFHNLLINDNEIYLENRIRVLNSFVQDLDDLLIQHLSYIFTLNSHYMMSSDYTDYLDFGMEPIEGSQYLVAAYVQDMFDKVIRVKRPDIAAAIKEGTSMKIE